MNNRHLAYVYLTITTCAWGSLYVASKFVLNRFPPFTLLFSRYLISALLLFLFLRKKKLEKIAREDYIYIFFIGFVGYFLSVGAALVGTKLASASLSSLINATNPIFIILFAVLIIKENITVSKIMSVISAISGTYIILGGARDSGQTLGVIFSIGAVLAWSLSSIAVRKITQKYDSLTITYYGFLIAVVFSLPVSVYELATTPVTGFFEPAILSAVVYIGVFCTAIPHILWNKSLSLIEASTCSLFYPLQPLISVFLGILLLGETVNTSIIIGAILIISGILISILGNKKSNPE